MNINRRAVNVAKAFYFAPQRVQTQIIRALERKPSPWSQACLVAIAYVMMP